MCCSLSVSDTNLIFTVRCQFSPHENKQNENCITGPREAIPAGFTRVCHWADTPTHRSPPPSKSRPISACFALPAPLALSWCRPPNPRLLPLESVHWKKLSLEKSGRPAASGHPSASSSSICRCSPSAPPPSTASPSTRCLLRYCRICLH